MRAQTEAEEDAAGERTALGAGHQHVGAGRAFRELQVAVLFDDERAAQRHHKEDAEIAADERQHEDAEVFEIEAEKDERGKSEDDARGDGLAGIARGLDDDAFEDGNLALVAEKADGDDRNGNGGGHGEPGAQAHIDGDGAEDDAEKCAQQHGAKGELGRFLGGGNEGLKVGQR